MLTITHLSSKVNPLHISQARYENMSSNPILKGFNPDPSICQANGKFYIAVSTFEYFPGVTLYESEDLSTFRYVHSALSKESQLDLKGCKNSTGIYAPTLRFNEGTFYLVTTNKHTKWNFIVHANDIKGPWSDPLLVSPMGIDPSLFFDDDGTCYYTSNGTIEGQKGIVGAPIDPDTGRLLAPLSLISKGCSGCATEAPHIYKRNAWYYLVMAEGGTEYGHHSVVVRSKTLGGPYEENPHNPILSHTHRKGHPIQCTGHADLLRLENGRWVAVFLAIRMPGRALLHNLGRESFLAEVAWEKDWPIIGDGGMVELGDTKSKLLFVDFSQDLEDYPLLKVRTPKKACYLQDADEAALSLQGEQKLSATGESPTLLAIRQEEFCSTFEAHLDTENLTAKAGVVAWYNSDYHVKLQVCMPDEATLSVSLIRQVHGFEARSESITLKQQQGLPLLLQIISDTEHYHFFCNGTKIGSASIACLCSEATMYMTFTGTLFGIYAEEGNATFKKGLMLS